MVAIEGKFTTVKTQDYVDFWSELGFSRKDFDELLGTRWTMEIWTEADGTGIRFRCHENPRLNFIHLLKDGVETFVDHSIFGGSAKVMLRKVSNGFTITSESSVHGKIVREYKISDEGMKVTTSSKGKSLNETWTRVDMMEGDFIMDKSENLENFLKTIGYGDLIPHMNVFKVNFRKRGNSIFVCESYGSVGLVSNMLSMDKESPHSTILDKQGERPSASAVMTMNGVNDCNIVVKNKNGCVEDIKFLFHPSGLEMTWAEKKSGVKCKIMMRRFIDFSGTFKICSRSNVENFAIGMGIPVDRVKELMHDSSRTLVITDKGNGWMRFQMIGTTGTVDCNFKLNEEFTYFNPILMENVRAVVTVSNNTICCNSKTSRGTVRINFHVNDNFVVMSLSKSSHVGETFLKAKLIFERLPFDLSHMSGSAINEMTNVSAACSSH